MKGQKGKKGRSIQGRKQRNLRIKITKSNGGWTQNMGQSIRVRKQTRNY